MQYLDTRSGTQQPRQFADILLSALAPSGGLWSPASVPALGHIELQSAPRIIADSQEQAAKGDFCLDAAAITSHWTGDWADTARLRQLFASAWQGWGDQGPPLRQLDEDIWLMELFHGPSLAFKDFGLSFLARCFDEQLQQRGERGVVLVATSGDTGAAAVEALKGLAAVQLVVLMPDGRVSQVQRRQMTCGLSPGVHPLVVQGNFDDCQQMVRHCLNRSDLMPSGCRLLGVNSINFGRVLAQLSYYFVLSTFLAKRGQPATFAVPSGNFGNAYAAWLARQAGAPIARVLVGCNRNDALHRFLQTGHFARSQVQQTLSPAMDIGLPSNLERLLFELADCDSEKLAAWGRPGGDELKLEAEVHRQLDRAFASSSCDDERTAAEIALAWEQRGLLLDPHTAVGVAAARDWRRAGGEGPVVVAATAHPCKFPEAMQAAGLPPVPLPDALQKRLSGEERYRQMEPEPGALENYLVELLASI